LLSSNLKEATQRLSAHFDPGSQNRRRRLKKRDFTIVSNDCWGAEVYKDLHLPFNTPLIGTFVSAPCFLSIAENPEKILSAPITFREISKYDYIEETKARYGRRFPTGVLADDVEIHFLHYESTAEAKAKWTRRASRINFERLFFKLSADKDLCTDEIIRAFDQLAIRKLVLSSEPHPDQPSVVTTSNYTIDGKSMYAISVEHFDIVEWLNG
jgi:uncharacterized protein (DUF1919 family)